MARFNRRHALVIGATFLVACQAVIGLDHFKKDDKDCDFKDCSVPPDDSGLDGGAIPDAPDPFNEASALHRWVAWKMPNPPDAETDANVALYDVPVEAGVDGGKILVVKDLVTNLQWMVTSGPQLALIDAQNFCTGLGNDFRLPTRIELLSLWDYTRSNPAFAPVFSGAGGAYWTQSPGLPDKTTAWIVDFGLQGGATRQKVENDALVRCVR